MALIFPSDLGSNAQSSNFMGFQSYTLTGGLGSGKSDRSYNQSGVPVFLPIPVEGLQDQYVNNWGNETVSMAKMALGGALKGVGAGVTSSAGLIDTIKAKISVNAKEAASGVEGFASVAEDWDQGNLSMESIKSMAMGTAAGISPLGVGMAVGTLGNAVVQSSGIAGFEETSVAYTGPQFRSFSFNFSLKPLTEAEQLTIESIVNYFKFAAAPQELSGALYRIYSLPKVFEIKFYHKDGENHSLPKINKCALTNIGIKYGGDRFQTFATGHAPVQTDISLQFIELVLQTKNTLQSNESGEWMGREMGAGGMVDDFGSYHEAKVAEADAKATATAVDDFSSVNGERNRIRRARTDSASVAGDGSSMGAIKSKASGGASFIPDGGSG